MSYKIDTPPQPQRIINAQPSIQTSPMQSATQQLQVAAQQLNTGQHPHNAQQLQPTQNYFAANHTNHSPYGTIRGNSMARQGSMTTPQNPIAAQTQTQAQASTTPVDANANVYRGAEFTWPTAAAAYYGYGSAGGQQQQQQQQQQQDWGQARGAGVFR
jgi:hypothetical protein